MNDYSQNGEGKIIAGYFKGKTGRLLSIGENDGKTLSNVLHLIEAGWSADLVEPSPAAFEKLKSLHQGNDKVRCHQFAISNYNGMASFHDSGSHLNNGDTSLLSTLNQADKDKWAASTEFKTIDVPVLEFGAFHFSIDSPQFDFISIDAEGEDVKILQQMNLRELGCKCLIVEHNSDRATELSIRSHAEYYGLKKVLLRNAENICLTV
jgi:FkbM family methyltransferase